MDSSFIQIIKNHIWQKIVQRQHFMLKAKKYDMLKYIYLKFNNIRIRFLNAELQQTRESSTVYNIIKRIQGNFF